jgi:trimethylamine--corrinoid protein Co-methyltransferase
MDSRTARGGTATAMTATVPTIRLLSLSEMESIHNNALAILGEIGIKFNSLRALSILSDAGCVVDLDDRWARIPANLVEKAIRSAPRKVLLAGRKPEQDINYGSGRVHAISSAQSVFFKDLDTRRRRASTLADLIQCANLCDALDQIDEFCPMVVPNDVPPVMRRLHAAKVALQHTGKHIVGGFGSLQTLPYYMQMMDAILGDRKKLRDRPIVSHVINDVSPLQKDGNLVDVTLELSDFRVPILLYFMPLSGSTAPVTLAGTLLQMTANMLGSLVLYQLVEPGWPILWGAGPGTIDMRSGRFAGGPEAVLMSLAHVEMANYFGLPSISGAVGSDNAKEINFQSGLDAILSCLPVALAGPDSMWGIADLDGANLVDLPYIVLGAEVMRQVRRLLRGFALDDEHFLMQAIKEVGFRGDYLGHPSTKKYFREEHLIPDLLPRESYEAWVARGESEAEMAIARVRKILAAHEREPIEPSVEQELNEILAAAERELAVT